MLLPLTPQVRAHLLLTLHPIGLLFTPEVANVFGPMGALGILREGHGHCPLWLAALLPPQVTFLSHLQGESSRSQGLWEKVDQVGLKRALFHFCAFTWDEKHHKSALYLRHKSSLIFIYDKTIDKKT